MKKTVLTFCAIAGLGLQAMAQGSTFWTPQATGFATPTRGLADIDITSPTNAWAIGLDGTAPDVGIDDFTRTTNGGTTWVAGDIGALASGWRYANLSAVDANTAWVAMFNDVTENKGRVLKTSDGGVTWTQQAATAFTNNNSFLNIVHMFDANKGWLQGDPVNGEFEMYTTTNGGTTWTAVPGANIPNPQSQEFGTVDVYTTVGNNIIYFGTNQGRIFKSTDAGLTWTVGGSTGLSEIHDVAFSSATHGLARQGSDLARTTDGGQTWISVPYSGQLYGNDLKYVPGTTSTYVTTGNGAAAQGLAGSSYSVDGGLTCNDLDNGFGRTKVDFFSPGVGFAGGFSQSATSGGIFKFTGTVGINDKEFSKNVSVFPNPSNGLVNIEVTKGNGSNIAINVIDALGRSVYTETAALNDGVYANQLDLSSLTKGVYMLQLQTGENVSIRKIVIE